MPSSRAGARPGRDGLAGLRTVGRWLSAP